MYLLSLKTGSFCTRSLRSFARLSLILAIGINSVLMFAENKKPKLSNFYTEWLNRDVTYIITRDEKKAFLSLTTDEARDNFIQRFWEIRNPTPGSPANNYKDEIYRRIAYADAHFGVGSGGEGWRTDRGRTYITLGAPQQIRTYYGAPNLRPMEIWFYSNLNSALPPFFYVLFYQPDNIGDFRYYSPSLDGPDKLIANMEAINDPQAALHMIQSSVGPEVARIAQTLIPNEPLDPNGRISLESDVMLANLRNFANQPSNVDDIRRKSELAASVTSRMILNVNNLDITLFPLRTTPGVTRLDYAVRLRKPGDLTVMKEEDGTYKYAIEVRVNVLTSDKKLIFTQQKSIAGNFGDEPINAIKTRPIGYEGILPLPPGKYLLDFLFTDWTKKVGYEAEKEVTIPPDAPGTFVIPTILPFSSVEAVDPVKGGLLPFAVGGLRFKPLESSALVLNPGQDLQVAYQVWASPNTAQTQNGQNLAIQYALGEPALTGGATVIKDTANMADFTAAGSLVNGKKIEVGDKPEGTYMLTVSANGPNVEQRAHSTFVFQLLSDTSSALPWDIDAPDIDKDEARGVFDLDRGLCFLAEDNITEARRWFRVALSKNHSDDVARAHLVQAYYDLQAYSAIASLFNDAGITDHTASGTIAQIAESMLKTGDSEKAISILKDAIRTRPDDGPLYIALADSYRQTGNQHGADEMMLKGKSLLGTPAPDSH